MNRCLHVFSCPSDSKRADARQWKLPSETREGRTGTGQEFLKVCGFVPDRGSGRSVAIVWLVPCPRDMIHSYPNTSTLWAEKCAAPQVCVCWQCLHCSLQWHTQPWCQSSTCQGPSVASSAPGRPEQGRFWPRTQWPEIQAQCYLKRSCPLKRWQGPA